MNASRDGCTHGRTQRAGLVGLRNSDGHVQYVGQGLHHKRRFFGYAPNGNYLPDGNALLQKPLHDGFRAKRCRFDQGFKHPYRVATQIQTRNGSFEGVIGIGGPAAIEPVERHRVILRDG